MLTPSIVFEEGRRKISRTILGMWLTLSVFTAIAGSIIAAILDSVSERFLRITVAIISPTAGLIAAVAVVSLVVAGPAGGRAYTLFRLSGSDFPHRVALVLTLIPVALGFAITYAQLQKVAEAGGLPLVWAVLWPASVVAGILAPLAGLVVMQPADDDFVRDAIDNEYTPVVPVDDSGDDRKSPFHSTVEDADNDATDVSPATRELPSVADDEQ